MQNQNQQNQSQVSQISNPNIIQSSNQNPQTSIQEQIKQFLTQTKIHQKQITQLFQHCKYQQAQTILTNCLIQGQLLSQKYYLISIINVELFRKLVDLYTNRCSLYSAIAEFQKCLEDAEECIKLIQLPAEKEGIWKYDNKPRIICMKISALLKLNREKQAQQYAQQCIKEFPYHKKLGQLAKLAKQKVIVENQDKYLDHIFQKLCLHPQVRQYLKDEAFLTKVQRMIRNPSLTTALQKMDPRIREASQAIMMADQNWG